MTLQYTDSTWKHQMRRSLDLDGEPAKGFWLDPFRYFRSDCPFVVGSHQQVAEVIADHLRKGVRRFILDLLPEEEEFANVDAAFSIAYEKAASTLD
jgi:alkanesulfonate monooxygenase